MKKAFSMGIILLLLSAAAMAQRGPGGRAIRYCVIQDNQVTPVERFRLHRDLVRFRTAERQARRDGVITAYERRRIKALKAKTRRDAYRFHHNRRRAF